MGTQVAQGNGSDDRIARVEALLDQGQVFLAQDAAQRLRDHDGAADGADDPHILSLYALALTRSGAAQTAEQVLGPLFATFSLDECADRDVLAAFRAASGDLAGVDPAHAPIAEVRRVLDSARAAMSGLMNRAEQVRLPAATLTLIGDCGVEIWRRTGRAAALDRARHAFADAARDGGGYRAQAMALLLGLATGAGAAERFAPPRERAMSHAAFWQLAARGAQALVAGDADGAGSAFAEARAAARATSHRVTVLRELLTLCAARDPAATDLAEVFRPPRIVVFAGMPFDAPGTAAPRCPPGLEGPLRAAIRDRLAALDAEIGYASASAGPDLLFLEAMLERGAETNLVLPFARGDFISERVAHAGPAWVRRFEIAEKLAASVSTATPGPYLGDRVLYRFGNQALHGAAVMRARQYGVAPELLSVWDMLPGADEGDVADFIDRWADMRRLHIIDIDDLGGGAAEVPVPAGAVPPPDLPQGRRQIRALLMADIVGSSRVHEAAMPAYADFLNRVAGHLSSNAPAPDFANTWGDAVFATARSALDLAEYALALQAAVQAFGGLDGAISPALGMRISLNAGPVLEAEDAITGRRGNFGSEIVRAARIEPVTTPNQIYATDAFVSLLLAEEAEARVMAETEGRDWASRFRLDYVGRVSLAKNAGAEGLHHLSAAPDAVAAEAAGHNRRTA